MIRSPHGLTVAGTLVSLEGLSVGDAFGEQSFRRPDGPLGAILVAPATTVGWNPVGDSLIESVISRTIREYNIDPDRIYIAGQSMGGHLSWRSAIHRADRFAAFSPQSGGYASYVADHLTGPEDRRAVPGPRT